MSNCTANNTPHGTTAGPTTGPVNGMGHNPYYGTSNFWPNGYFYGPTPTTGNTTDPTGQFVPGFTPQFTVQNPTPWIGQAWNAGGYGPTFFNPYTAFNGYTPTFGFNPFVNTTGYANFAGYTQPFGYNQIQGNSPFGWQHTGHFNGQYNNQFNAPFTPQGYGYQNYGYPTGTFPTGYQGGFNTTPGFTNTFTNTFNNGFNSFNTPFNTTPWNYTPFNTTPWGVPSFNTGWNTQNAFGQTGFNQPWFTQTGCTQPTFTNQYFQGGFNPFFAAWQNGFNGFGYNAQTNTQFANQFVNQQQAEATFRRNIGLCRDAA